MFDVGAFKVMAVPSHCYRLNVLEQTLRSNKKSLRERLSVQLLVELLIDPEDIADIELI